MWVFLQYDLGEWEECGRKMKQDWPGEFILVSSLLLYVFQILHNKNKAKGEYYQIVYTYISLLITNQQT